MAPAADDDQIRCDLLRGRDDRVGRLAAGLEVRRRHVPLDQAHAGVVEDGPEHRTPVALDADDGEMRPVADEIGSPVERPSGGFGVVVADEDRA